MKCFAYPHSFLVLHSINICPVAIKISETYNLFQPIKLQLFCILTIISKIINAFTEFYFCLFVLTLLGFQCLFAHFIGPHHLRQFQEPFHLN